MPKEIILLRHGPKLKATGLSDLEVPAIDPTTCEDLTNLYKSTESQIDLAKIALILHSDAPRTQQTAKYLYQLASLIDKYNEISKIEIPDSYKIVSNNLNLQNSLEQIYIQIVKNGNSPCLNLFRSNIKAFEAIIAKGEKLKTDVLKLIINLNFKEQTVLIISHEIVLQAIAYAFIKTDEILNMSISELEGCKIDLENQKIYPIKHT